MIKSASRDAADERNLKTLSTSTNKIRPVYSKTRNDTSKTTLEHRKPSH